MDEINGNMLLGDRNASLYNGPVLVDGVKDKALSLNGHQQWVDLGYTPLVCSQAHQRFWTAWSEAPKIESLLYVPIYLKPQPSSRCATEFSIDLTL